MIMKISPGNGLAFRIGKGLDRGGKWGGAPDGDHSLVGVFSAERQSLPRLAGKIQNARGAGPMKNVMRRGRIWVARAFTCD
jgi:hypothetical protein